MEGQGNTTSILKTYLELPVDLKTSCRLCGNPSLTVVKIFTEEGLCSDLGNKINLYLPVKVQPGDGLSGHCCWSCTHIVISWHDLYLTCKTTEEKLMVLQKVHSAETGVLEDIKHVVKEEHQDLEEESLQPPGEEPKIEETTESAEELQEHNQDGLMETLKDSDEAKRVSCHVCNKSFKSKLSCYYHIRGVHEKEPRRTKVPCPICGLERAEKYMYLHLARKHSEERPFCCEICGKTFKVEMDLRLHRVSHSNLRPSFKCQLCPKMFKRKDSLRLHQIMHSEKKIFFCKLCGKKIVGRTSLSCHIQQTHDMTKEQYDQLPLEAAKQMDLSAAVLQDSKDNDDLTCNICEKTFKSKRIRNAHIKEVHENMQIRKKCSCPICGVVVLKSHLKEHLAKHSEERPFPCKTCGRCFKLERYLRRHMLTSHHNEIGMVK